jgi:hypothetical protein
VSGIVRLVSGSPIKVQAGIDLDGDQTITGDRPPGVPITVGRDRVEESLAAINRFRASQQLAPLDRRLLDLDPYRSVEIRLSKSTRLGAGHVEVFVEVFNAFNTVNLRTPIGAQPEAGVSLNSAAALVRTAARDARQLQWGARYRF